MSPIARACVLAIFVVLPLACAGSESSTTAGIVTVTDTMGVTYSVSCSTSFCTLTPQDPSITPLSCELGNGVADAFILIWDRIMKVHAMRLPSDGNLQFNAADPGHPLVCTSDADCQLTSYPFVCLDGLCQRGDVMLTTNDVIALCQSDIPWPASCPYVSSPLFATRMLEVAATCGSNVTCTTVPADCRQPTTVVPTLPADGGAQPAIDAGP